MTLAEALDVPAGAEAAVAAALGLIFGSFANVCIHRLPDRRSVVWPGSSCPSCGAAIRWHDNIPLFSWIALGGKCRSCRGLIPTIYPVVELVTAVLLIGLWAQHGLTWRWAALAWFAVSIVILVPIDWRHGILPDRVTFPGILAGLGFSFLTMDPPPVAAARGAIVGAALPMAVRLAYGLYALARESRARESAGGAPSPIVAAGPESEAEAAERREGMGLGDVKMLAMVGAFLGPGKALLTMLLGSTLGALWVIPLLATRRYGMKTALPFGPFLGAGALVAALWGDALIAWYLGILTP